MAAVIVLLMGALFGRLATLARRRRGRIMVTALRGSCRCCCWPTRPIVLWCCITMRTCLLHLDPSYEGYVATDPPPVTESGADDGAGAAVNAAPDGGQMPMGQGAGVHVSEERPERGAAGHRPATVSQPAASQTGNVGAGDDYRRAIIRLRRGPRLQRQVAPSPTPGSVAPAHRGRTGRLDAAWIGRILLAGSILRHGRACGVVDLRADRGRW